MCVEVWGCLGRRVGTVGKECGTGGVGMGLGSSGVAGRSGFGAVVGGGRCSPWLRIVFSIFW